MSKQKKWATCIEKYRMQLPSMRDEFKVFAVATTLLRESEAECEKLRKALQSAYDDVYGCQVSGCNDAVTTMETALDIRGEQGF